MCAIHDIPTAAKIIDSENWSEQFTITSHNVISTEMKTSPYTDKINQTTTVCGLKIQIPSARAVIKWNRDNKLMQWRNNRYYSRYAQRRLRTHRRKMTGWSLVRQSKDLEDCDVEMNWVDNCLNKHPSINVDTNQFAHAFKVNQDSMDSDFDFDFVDHFLARHPMIKLDDDRNIHTSNTSSMLMNTDNPHDSNVVNTATKLHPTSRLFTAARDDEYWSSYNDETIESTHCLNNKYNMERITKKQNNVLSCMNLNNNITINDGDTFRQNARGHRRKRFRGYIYDQAYKLRAEVDELREKVATMRVDAQEQLVSLGISSIDARIMIYRAAQGVCELTE